MPGVVQFASADTIVPDPMNPQSFNRYAYVQNNPVNATDPNGHCADNDEACWEYLETEFCQGIDCGYNGWDQWIIAGGTSIWTIRDLEVVKNGILASKLALRGAGINDWVSAFGDVRFERSQEDGNSFYFRDVITLTSRWNWEPRGDYKKQWNASGMANAFRVVLHEMGHAFDNASNGLSNFIPMDVFGESQFTAHGYYYRHYGRIGMGDMAPYNGSSEGFADIYAAWVWNDSYNRGNRTFAWRPQIAPEGGVRHVGNLHPIQWDDMYALMTSLIGQ